MSEQGDEERERARDGGYDDWLDALAEGEGYYLDCPDEHGSLPPRRVCPVCGSTDLTERALPDAGEVATFTVVHVGAPEFDDRTPYVTAVVDFGPVRLTGVVDVDPEAVAVGDTVEPSVDRNSTTGERLVAFHPR